MPRLPRYTPSGRTTALFFVMAIVVAALAALVAWPYQRLVTWVPFIYINAVVYLVFAFVVAVCAMAAIKIGRNRNRMLGAIVGAVIGASAIGASHWFAYRHAIAEVTAELPAGAEDSPEVQAAMDEALTFGTYVRARVDTGWSLGRSGSSGKGDLTGLFVWLIWGIEALGVIGAAAYVGSQVEPFCEACGTWMKEREVWVRTDLDAASASALAHVVSADELLRPPVARDAPSRVKVAYTTYVCPTCASPGYVTLEKRWDEAMGDGRPSAAPIKYETKKETLLEVVELSRAQLAQLDAARGQAEAQPPPST
ncbi:MAG: hypothetical protein K8W52_11960 [Deltaproteobacteria bacterium]|nr:hypothetical protein [Deltaproteobacteria bacterium]